MKTMRIGSLFFILVLLCGAAYSQAPTITFNVPLQLNDLNQEVDGVGVTCLAYDGGGTMVGFGQMILENIPENGDLNKTITVVATESQGKDITTATRYSCSFKLEINGSAVTPEINPNRPIECQAKEGTLLRSEVTGTITW